MKRYFFVFILLLVLSALPSGRPPAVAYADNEYFETVDEFYDSVDNTEFEMDYEQTGSDGTYNYYTLSIRFSNPEGCKFGYYEIYACDSPECSCDAYREGDCDKYCASIERTSYDAEYADGIVEAVEVSMTYSIATFAYSPVYRFVYIVDDRMVQGATYLRFIVGEKTLEPSVTPEPTAVPEVSPVPEPEEPEVSVSIGAAYSGDEFTVSSTGTVNSSYTGTAVLEIWARGSEERCVSATTFESGTASISFSADRYSPYKRFYGKITYTYTDAGGNTRTVVKYTHDDVVVKFQDYVPEDESKIGNLGDLLHYTWDELLELEIPFEGYSISFKAIILFIIIAMAVIVFIKRQLGY